jgi:anti-sigma factor RsiW
VSEFKATCATYAEDLSALLDGELAEPREVEVLGHLESCSDCTGRVEALRRVDAALAAASAATVPANLRARLDARLSSERNASQSPSAASREERRTRWFAHPAIGVATAAAAALALYVGVASVQTVDLDDLSEEDLAMALELDTIEDLEEIANLDLLVRLLEFEEAG